MSTVSLSRLGSDGHGARAGPVVSPCHAPSLPPQATHHLQVSLVLPVHRRPEGSYTGTYFEPEIPIYLKKKTLISPPCVLRVWGMRGAGGVIYTATHLEREP